MVGDLMILGYGMVVSAGAGITGVGADGAGIDLGAGMQVLAGAGITGPGMVVSAGVGITGVGMQDLDGAGMQVGVLLGSTDTIITIEG